MAPGSDMSEMCLSLRRTWHHAGGGVLTPLTCSWNAATAELWLFDPFVATLRKPLNPPFIFRQLISTVTSCFLLSLLFRPCSIYLPVVPSFPKTSPSAPPLLPLPQLHLTSISLFSSFHVTAAIFSPYLEPAILSLSVILRRTPGSFLPERA